MERMKAEMDKAYEPAKFESEIYRQWEALGAFAPSDDPQAKPYCIIMPLGMAGVSLPSF